MRPGSHRRDSPQLALLARPPYRRLCADPQPGDRLSDLPPRRLGFRMPAEWAPHEATWIAWPHNRQDWPGRYAPIPWTYAEIVRKLSRVEKVRILVEGAVEERQARRVLRKTGAEMAAVEFFHCPTDRVWTRDYAPLFVRNRKGAVAAVKWRFNGWAKYPNHKQDDAAGRYAAKHAEASETWALDMVLEG